MTTLIQDIRYGLRQLRRSPGVAVAAVLTLALGIGANTAIFTLANSAFFRRSSLPQRRSSRLPLAGQFADGRDRRRRLLPELRGLARPEPGI